jgi:hypothetical protein
MADNQEHQATQPNELQPQIDAEEPKPVQTRNLLRPQKADSVIWITAVISAVAALAGVLAGAFTFHYATQPRPSGQSGASKSSATAKAKTDLINKRQKDYADYFKDQRNLVNTEATVVFVLRSAPDDLGALKSVKEKWNNGGVTAARSDFVLSLNGSDKANNIREEISHQTSAIDTSLARLIDQAYGHQPIDQPGLQDLDSRFVAIQAQFDRFTDQAKTELRTPNGGLSA